MTKPNAARFNDALRQLDTPGACQALFASAIAPLGFDTFASGQVDLINRERSTFHLIDWPEQWRKFYMRSGLLERDPLLNELAFRTMPFTWSDLRADHKLAKVGRDALDQCAAAGWSEGFIVPLPQSSGRIGLISLAGHRDCRDPDERDYLTLICICLHSYVRTLLVRHGFAIPPAGLTDREISCLRLAAKGMTDRAIAENLGIGTTTAHEFIEKAKRRMQVRSRAELVAIAVALGIADV
jgi:LuxR family quorum sensing-dependent transcriptional regulator